MSREDPNPYAAPTAGLEGTGRPSYRRPDIVTAISVMSFLLAGLLALILAGAFLIPLLDGGGPGPKVGNVWFEVVAPGATLVALVVSGVGLLYCALWAWGLAVGYYALLSVISVIAVATGAIPFLTLHLLQPVVWLIILFIKPVRQAVGLAPGDPNADDDDDVDEDDDDDTRGLEQPLSP